MPQLNREGSFRLRVTDTKIRDTDKSQAVALSLDFEVESQWDPSTKKWGENWPVGHTVSGDVWIVGKEGNPNDENVKRLVECLGWDGDLDSIEKLVDRVCQGTVDSEDYNGKKRFRVEWINAYGRAPGGKTASPETVSKLKSSVGEKLRAVASTTQYIAPPAPPKPPLSTTTLDGPAPAVDTTGTRTGPPKSTPPTSKAPPINAARAAGVKDQDTAWAYILLNSANDNEKATTAWTDAVDARMADYAAENKTVQADDFTADDWITVAQRATKK